MYEIVNLTKTFKTEKQEVLAVSEVNLSVSKHDIFGIIGSSGAGKSTLIRCLNALERPDEGEVFFKGNDILKLSEKDLREERKKIGVIFQHFNLLNAKTVYDNIAFALRGQKKEHIENKVLELLNIVGLSDKKDAYPKQLSGGQKQRVAIARALANDPDVLLCDEATSALDPQTTQSILELLKELNESLDLTIILITHEMSVIKSICNRVAVMSKGEVVEVNDVVSLFTKPQTEISKAFISDTYNLNSINSLDLEKRIYELVYGSNSSDRAIISALVRDFDLDVNILAGSVEIVSKQTIGRLVVSIDGNQQAIEDAIAYLNQEGVDIHEFH